MDYELEIKKILLKRAKQSLSYDWATHELVGLIIKARQEDMLEAFRAGWRPTPFYDETDDYTEILTGDKEILRGRKNKDPRS